MKSNMWSKVICHMLSVTMILVALSGISFAQNTIKVGVVSPFTGDLASYGIPVKNAVELAVKKINDAGGVRGLMIEVVAEDDVCDANTATSVATKLVTAKVNAVVGHLCSGASKAALPIYKSANIPVISPASTSPTLTMSGDNPHFLRTIAHDAAQAELQVKFAMEMGAKKVAVVHDKGDYGKGLASLAKEGFEKGGVEVALYEGITPGAVDYSALVRKIRRAKVDTVIFGGYHPEASKIVTQARKARIKANFISGDGVKDPSFLKIAGKNAEGYYASAPMDTAQLAMAKTVSADYKAAYGEDPGTFSLQAYAAVLAIARAVETSGVTQFEPVLNALRSNKVDTPIGMINFDENGDVLGTGFTMYQARGGEFVEAK